MHPHPHPHILADQLPLFKPGGQIIPTTSLLAPPSDFYHSYGPVVHTSAFGSLLDGNICHGRFRLDKKIYNTTML